MQVLFVDDDVMTLQMLSMAAKGAGFTVISEISAESGFEAAVALRPDVIVLDYNMPEKNGVELLKEIRAHSEIATTPVIMLTASPNTEIKDAFLAAGGQQYITKPIELENFFEVIRDHAK
jgi:DNA-binding response OmpR family regulator